MKISKSTKYRAGKRQSKQTRGRYILITLFVAVCVFAVLEATGTINLLGSKSNSSSAGQETKGEVGANSSNQSSTEPNTSSSTTSGQYSDQKSSNSSNTANQNLIVPYGNFVSNHMPNLSGSPTPNTIQSVCNTTPGAKCQIIFTKSGSTKSLPAKNADSNGSVFWTWKLQDYGLTAGAWSITAKATLGTQTKTATSALQLSVQP